MIGAIIIFALVLGVLVLVHEIGHFVTARWMGVLVEEFGVGFPPRLLSITRNNTVYSLNLIPLGGFVRIKGETGGDKNEVNSFSHKTALQRSCILSAGVLMNFILAFVLLSIGFMYGVPQEIAPEKSSTALNAHILIVEVESNSPAFVAGIQPGDSIAGINEYVPKTPEDIIGYIQSHTDTELRISILRGSEKLDIRTRPALYGSHTSPILGIGTILAGTVRYGFFESWYRGAVATINLIAAVIVAFGGLLASLLQGKGIGEQVSGPVGVAVLTNQVAKLGIPYLINFTAMLSVNLGILNILPFPALDGGRVLFVMLEKIKGRPINARIENLFHSIGFALLILLIIFITYQDFVSYGGQILGGLKKLIS